LNKYLQHCRLACCLLLLLVLTAGCGSGRSAGGVADKMMKVRTMGDLYAAHLAEKKGPPADEAAWRAFLDSKQTELQAVSLTVDEMFVSPRDGAPLTWVYGKVPKSQFGVTVIAYEQAPVDGRRYTVATKGMADYVEESRFQAMKLGAAK
jgi:hypothetical protein